MNLEIHHARRAAAQACTRAIHRRLAGLAGRRLPQSTNGNSRFKSSMRFRASMSLVSAPVSIRSTNTSQLRPSELSEVRHGSETSIPGISTCRAFKRCTSTSNGTNSASRDLNESVAEMAHWQPATWISHACLAPVDVDYSVSRPRQLFRLNHEGGRHVTGSAVRAHESQSEAGRRYAGTAGRRETSSRRPANWGQA